MPLVQPYSWREWGTYKKVSLIHSGQCGNMVLQNVVQHKQPLPGHHTQVILSKEARVAVAAERDKRSENFRNALNTTMGAAQ